MTKRALAPEAASRAASMTSSSIVSRIFCDMRTTSRGGSLPRQAESASVKTGARSEREIDAALRLFGWSGGVPLLLEPHIFVERVHHLLRDVGGLRGGAGRSWGR